MANNTARRSSTDEDLTSKETPESSLSSSRPTMPLRLKLVGLAAILATIPPFVVGYQLIDVNAETVEILSREAQLAVVDDVARVIEGEFTDAQDDLTAIGRILTNDQLPEDQVIALALALVEASEVLDHTAVYDGAGRLIDIIREEEAPRLTHLEKLPEQLRDSADEHNTATGSAEIHSGWPRVLIVVPLRAQGEITGFAASLLSLRAVQQRVEHLAMARFQGSRDAVFVVDDQLRIVAHPNREKAQSLTTARDEEILQGGVRDQLLKGTLVRSGEFSSGDGTPMLASAAGLRRRAWAVIAQVPQANADASLGQMRRVVIQSVIIAIVVALLAGLVMAGRITAPLKKLTEFARNLAARRFDSSLSIRTRDELSVLASAMTQAASDLRTSEAQLRKELAIRADLGRYLPSELVDQIVKREREVVLGGERRQVTVLFADVVAFTPLTEKRPPEEVVTILNELFTILTGIVFRHGGTVDKFIGDCVMALWGAPTPQDDHAERALAAAEDMFRWLETGNATWQERYDVTIRLAIGIHSGEAVVGNIGSETRMEYTAIGDAVNVAARLESMARSQQILVSLATRDAAGEDFEYVDAGSHHLAGKEAPVQLFEVRI